MVSFSKKKSRILYFYSHQHVDTGPPKALIGMISLLNRTKFKPIFLATNEGPLLKALEDHNVKILRRHVSKVSIFTPLTSICNIWKQAKMLKKLRIDIVHVNEFGQNMDLVLGAWVAGVPTVLHIHNPETIKISNLHWLVGDKVLLVSKAASNVIKNFSKVRNKCSVVYNYVDLELIQSGKEIRASLGFEKNDIIIGVVAQLTPEKGTDIVIETARLLNSFSKKRICFLFIGRIGEGAASFVENMKDISQEPNLVNRIHFLGARTDIPNLLASLDLFFLPTLGETFCMAVVEAMAAALPVVASRVGALPELIPNPSIGTLVFPCTPENFATAITKILERQDHGRSMGEAARKSLQGRLDRFACTEQLEKVYNEILRNKIFTQ